MEVFLIVVISLFFIALNIRTIIKKCKHISGNNTKFIFQKDIILNFLFILLGIYFILMVLGQFLLLKILILLMGLFFIVYNVSGICESVKIYRINGRLLVFLIKTTFFVIGSVLGFILIVIGIASLSQ